MPRGKDGSIIGDATAVSTSSASGIWTMSEVHKYKTEGVWPSTQKAYGGDITPNTVWVSGYMIHVFTTTSAQDFEVSEATACDILVVAGGGTGGLYAGPGGGGAGGILYNSSSNSTITNASVTLEIGTYVVTVGAGGISTGDGYNEGDNGVDTTITGPSSFSYTATGGGRGAGSDVVDADTDGGSGGGGDAVLAGGEGTTGQGFDGTDQSTTGGGMRGGGGGGASQTASPNTTHNNIGSPGGDGIDYSSKFGTAYGWSGSVITGATSGVFGGGGGGGSHSEILTLHASYDSAGGDGGGGHGFSGYGDTSSAAGGYASTNSAKLQGKANTGGGGGALSLYAAAGTAPGNGGSGIVIIRYAIS